MADPAAKLVIFPLVLGFATLGTYLYIRRTQLQKIDIIVVVALCLSFVVAGDQMQENATDSLRGCYLKTIFSGTCHHVSEPLTRVYFAVRLYTFNGKSKNLLDPTLLKSIVLLSCAFTVFCLVTFTSTIEVAIVDDGKVCAPIMPIWYVGTFFGVNSVLDVINLLCFIRFLSLSIPSPDIKRLIQLTSISTIFSLVISVFTTVFFLYVVPTAIVLSYEAVFNAMTPAFPVIYVYFYKKAHAAKIVPKTNASARSARVATNASVPSQQSRGKPTSSAPAPIQP